MSKEKTGGHWKNRRRAIIGMHDTYKLQMVVEDQIMSKSSEWITDRLPTIEDAMEDTVLVWNGSEAILWTYDGVNEGQPWAPIHKLIAHYVKPKRWTVEWDKEHNAWIIQDSEYATAFQTTCLYYLSKNSYDAAQRICDIYNEVMP
jgi:hypothetical protein